MPVSFENLNLLCVCKKDGWGKQHADSFKNFTNCSEKEKEKSERGIQTRIISKMVERAVPY